MEKLIEIRTGSDSDIPKIEEAHKFLEQLKIPYSKRILSAHRTPDRMANEAQSLEKNGFKVSIGAAGGSAHLAGMTASETAVPVVALPVKSSLGGVDALLSMVQMPPGIPNGCVGINEARNAAILAARIAYLDDDNIRELISKELDTKIEASLNDIPNINIITDKEDLDTTLLDRLGVSYIINSHIDSPIVLYTADITKFPHLIPKDTEQISIAAPTVNNDNFDLVFLREIVTGPHAWVGVNRVSNGMIYAAQILGNYFPEVREKFKEYKRESYDQVVAKDTKLVEENQRS